MEMLNYAGAARPNGVPVGTLYGWVGRWQIPQCGSARGWSAQRAGRPGPPGAIEWLQGVLDANASRSEGDRRSISLTLRAIYGAISARAIKIRSIDEMKASRSKAALPLSVRRALEKLGSDISAARRRRRVPVSLMAQRAFVSRNTLARVERGDPSVSMGIWATALFVLGMSDRLCQLADPATDRVGLSLEEERLPKRVRISAGRPKGGRGGS